MTVPSAVVVDDVFVAYPSAPGAVMALRGLQLDVPAGEHLLIHGPNGSGKSTLLRVITAEQPVSAGRVSVGGRRLDLLTDRERRRWRARSVGFVDQHVRRGLLPELSVLDNVALQLDLLGTPRRVAVERAERSLERFGLTAWAARAVAELSGGEAQRVAVCAAVAHGPRLVLADEPTGELDDAAALAVYRLLAELTEDDTTVVLVSHDPRAERFAHRVVRIRDGRVAEEWQPGSAPRAVPDSRGWTLTSAAVDSRVGPPVPRADQGEDRTSAARTAPVAASPAVPSAPALACERAAPGSAAAAPTGDEPLLRLRAVSTGYGGELLFPPLDLAVPPGVLQVVAGPSGAGKSTLLALVTGLLDPRTGRVEVAGRDWAEMDRPARARWRRGRLAFAPQRPSLVEPLTVRENLDVARSLDVPTDRRGQLVDALPEGLAFSGSGSAGSGSAGAGPVLTVAERLGLSGLLDQQVRGLSGGERQRVGLACCLIRSAPLIVADEPTSQQDEQAAGWVRRALADEVAAGRSVVVTTHDAELLRSGPVLRLPGRSGPAQAGAAAASIRLG